MKSETEVDLIPVFKALGDETRLRIVNLLIQEIPVCVCEMTDALQLPQYHVSRHLIILKNAGLVEAQRDGTWIYYSIAGNITACENDLLAVIKKHFKEDYRDDIKRLKERLEKRQDERCVIGFIQDDTK